MLIKNKILILFSIGLFLVALKFISAYTAPVYNSVNFTLSDGYTAPVYNSVNFTLSETDVTDSCTYSGSGDWTIQISDNCTINDNTLGANKLIVNGTCGLLTVNGTTTANSIYRTPTSYSGCYQILINNNGNLGVLK